MMSYGCSMIVDPWGVVLAQVLDGEGWTPCRPGPTRRQRIRLSLLLL